MVHDPYGTPEFGNLYPGIGLEIDLGSVQTVHSIAVTSTTPGWSGQTYVSTTSVNSGQAVNATSWGTATATQTDISGDATFSLGGRRAQYVLLWITNLGPDRQANVAELKVT